MCVPRWAGDLLISAGKEVLARAWKNDLHIFLADAIKFFENVDRGIQDCASGRLGLLAWFRKGYLLCLSYTVRFASWRCLDSGLWYTSMLPSQAKY